MPIDEIRSRAERFERKVRLWNISTAVLFAVLIIGEARQVWSDPDLVGRTGDLLTIAALVHVAYWFRGRVGRQPNGSRPGADELR